MAKAGGERKSLVAGRLGGDALERSIGRHRLTAEAEQAPAEETDDSPISELTSLLTNEQINQQAAQIDSNQSNQLTENPTRNRVNKPSRNPANQRTDSPDRPLIDPLTLAVLDKLAAPYPEPGKGKKGKEDLVLVAGRIPQAIAERFELVVQHLDQRLKQEVLADALRDYIARMEREGRRGLR